MFSVPGSGSIRAGDQRGQDFHAAPQVSLFFSWRKYLCLVIFYLISFLDKIIKKIYYLTDHLVKGLHLLYLTGGRPGGLRYPWWIWREIQNDSERGVKLCAAALFLVFVNVS
jgi:hypothetical protein